MYCQVFSLPCHVVNCCYKESGAKETPALLLMLLYHFIRWDLTNRLIPQTSLLFIDAMCMYLYIYLIYISRDGCNVKDSLMNVFYILFEVQIIIYGLYDICYGMGYKRGEFGERKAERKRNWEKWRERYREKEKEHSELEECL